MVERDIDPLAVDLRQPDWPALAAAFGAVGLEATQETLAATVVEALAIEGPSLIHLRI